MNTPLYSAEPFTKWQAWIDLCMLADTNGTVKISLEALKNRWFWGSKGRVARYLGTLSGTGYVTVIGTPNKGTVIRINPKNSAKTKGANGTENGTVNGTENGIEESTSKEVVGSTSLEKSRPTTEVSKKIINESNNYSKKRKEEELLRLQEELDDEYE